MYRLVRRLSWLIIPKSEMVEVKKTTTSQAEKSPEPKQPQVAEQQPSDQEKEQDEAQSADDEEQEPVSDEGEQEDDDDDDDDEAPDSSADEQEEEDDEPASDGEGLEAVGFGDAMSKILQQNVAEDAQPILAKRTTARMREISNEKKETKTARMSAAEKRAKEQKDVVIPDHTTAVQDRKLRMIATKGGAPVGYTADLWTSGLTCDCVQWWRYLMRSRSTSTRTAAAPRTRRTTRRVILAAFAVVLLAALLTLSICMDLQSKNCPRKASWVCSRPRRRT